jgi:hypothetical protein
VQALSPVQAVASVCGLEAGLHAFVACDTQVQIESLVQNCWRQGILLTDLSRYHAAEPRQRGVVLGYGGLERHKIEWVGRQIRLACATRSHERWAEKQTWMKRSILVSLIALGKQPKQLSPGFVCWVAETTKHGLESFHLNLFLVAQAVGGSPNKKQTAFFSFARKVLWEKRSRFSG